MKYLFLLFVVLSFSSCKQAEEKKVDTELNELFSLMQGSYNSEIQAQKDSTYYNISLHMYPIWRKKGNFLYVEQALNVMQDKPYRQRIYEVSRVNDSIFKSAVYLLPIDSLWVGKWRTPEVFDQLSINDITLKDGCEVLLKRKDKNTFSGETGIQTCKSELRGASYATSEVNITQDKIESWDRGFDAEGTHVWGAEKSGYIFDKIKLE